MRPAALAAPGGREVQEQELPPIHHLVREAPVIQPIFAADRSPFHPAVDRFWQVLERGAAGDAGISPEMIATAAEGLIELLHGRVGERTRDGFARFRREFCLGQLESIAALKGNAESDRVIQARLRGDGVGSANPVDSSIRAGVADLNERYIASLRKRYVAKGGLGEKIVARLVEFQDAVVNSHPGVGVAAGRHGEQATNAGRLLKQFGDVTREIQTFLLVVPHDRALLMECQEHMEGIRFRLRTNHFGGVSQLSDILIGDIREGINVLKLLADPTGVVPPGAPRRPSRRA